MYKDVFVKYFMKIITLYKEKNKVLDIFLYLCYNSV